jgi:predicted phosphoadenosine phosphosulfate sulfurtransferase
MNTRKRTEEYVANWMQRGYLDDIPDEVPHELSDELLAPSYKAIAIAILNNDLQLTSLGFEPRQSKWYSVLKRIEIDARPNDQQRLF